MERTTTLFGNIAAVFGSKWQHTLLDDKGNYTAEFKVWDETLAEVTNKQFSVGWAETKRRAEQRTLNNEPNFPPTAFEFNVLCTKKPGTWEQRVIAEHDRVEAVKIEAEKKEAEEAAKNGTPLLEDDNSAAQKRKRAWAARDVAKAKVNEMLKPKVTEAQVACDQSQPESDPLTTPPSTDHDTLPQAPSEPSEVVL